MIKFYRQDTIGAQIVDAWCAKQQAGKMAKIDQIDQIQLLHAQRIHQTDTNTVNIAIGYQFDNDFVDQRHLFDLVFLCNGGEPLEVSSPKIKSVLEEPNVYLIANAFLSPTHALYHKVVWFPHNVMTCNDYWTRHFYPQYFENARLSGLDRTGSMIWINGQNRANRHHFWKRLQEAVPSILCHDGYTSGVRSVGDCQWETEHDRSFRRLVNDLHVQSDTTSRSVYYDNSISVGINGKFGKIPPGYFLLPLYYENHCVIFPESAWINDQLTVTEKILKCFFSGSLAWPVGGANINHLYNQIGFGTAWNLLPDRLQRFDSDPDHARRVEGAVESIQWLWHRPEIMTGTQAQEIVKKNRERFLTNASHVDYVDRFDQIINSALSERTTHGHA
jgi:hypothetical protein